MLGHLLGLGSSQLANHLANEINHYAILNAYDAALKDEMLFSLVSQLFLLCLFGLDFQLPSNYNRYCFSFQ